MLPSVRKITESFGKKRYFLDEKILALTSSSIIFSSWDKILLEPKVK